MSNLILSPIEVARQQRRTAETMRDVARESCATAGLMYDSADRMRKAANAVLVATRGQLLAAGSRPAIHSFHR